MLKFLLKSILRLLFNVRIKGDIASLNQQNIIITPNHVSFLDGLLLALFLPTRPVFAVYTGHYSHWSLKIARRYVDFIPMDPSNPLSIKTLIKVAKTGQPVIIFPEGRITITGSLMKIYDGAAFVAVKSNSKIIPIWIDGAEFSMTSRLKGVFRQRLFPKITMHITKEQVLTMPETSNIDETRRILGKKLYQIMQQARMESSPKTTLIDAYLSALVKFGAKRKMIQDPMTKETSYREFLLKILGLSAIFVKNTTQKEHVGILLPNSVTTAAAILGLTIKNRVPTMLNFTSGTIAIQKAIEIAEVKLVITSRSFLEKANMTYLVDEISDVQWCYLEDLKKVLSIKEKLIVYLCHLFPRFIKKRHYSEDDALILFTSGSEGAPKGVIHSHAGILANIEQIKSAIGIMPTDRFMSALPLFHAFGFTAGLVLPLFSGSRVFLNPNPLQYKLMPEIIYDQNCTVLFGTPTFLGNYAKYAHPYDFMQLRYVVAGAERLPESTKALWRDKFGIRVLEGYGVTECAPAISINVPMNYKNGTVGNVVPGMETKLIPVDGIEKGGRLLVKGPNLMKGYLLETNIGKMTFPDAFDEDGQILPGFYDTGDIVEIDDDDFITITGRFKRFAKIAGEMISLELVENLAKHTDSGACHAVVTISDLKKGEALVLFTTSDKMTRELLQSGAKQLGIPAIAIPRIINQIEALPLLGSGKIDFGTLKEQAESKT